MGVVSSQLEGGFTPICDECGIKLCWDISTEDYLADTEFWENWTCKVCDPEYRKKRHAKLPSDRR